MKNTLSIGCLVISFTALIAPLAWASSAALSVRDFGAKGDGTTKDTQAIQAALDKATITGGTVEFSPGRYLSGTLHLRSNVTVRIGKGAAILFSPDDEDFDRYEPLPYQILAPAKKVERQVDYVNHLPSERRKHSAPPAWDDTETSYFHYALFSGDGVNNVTIEGAGEIDSNRTRRGGPKPIAIKSSEWITIRGITIRNAPNYNISFLGTDHIEVEGVRLINGFADGIDPDSCRYVRITNSYIDVWDDAICPKASMALGKPRSTEHLVVANCILRTSCSNFKFGTETEGGLNNISVTNCVMRRRDAGRLPVAGIAIESVDGGNVNNIVISNIAMEDVLAPVFIRLGNRGRGMEKPAAGSIQNVSIRNIVATGASLASSITGVEGGRIRNLTVDGLNVTAAGGVAARDLSVPEPAAKYPDADMFGELPALAMYVRHADGLTLQGLKVYADTPDGRPAVIFDDVTRLEMSGFDSTNIPPSQPLVLLRDVAGALLHGNRLSLAADVFLGALGGRTSAVVLRSNDLHLARKPIQQSSEVPPGAISLEGETTSSH